ncbi:hypothetical protein KA082_00920 [Candidatus Woesebacteria bacterium]|nr:hypothetical protein [Candidatus Woesebacteria bacterium]
MQIDQINIRILFFTRKHFLYSIALGLLGVIIVFVVLIPQIQEVISIVGKLNTEQPKTEHLRKKLASLNNLVATAEYAQVSVVDAALPSRKPLLELMMSVSSVANTTGIQVDKFAINPGLVASDSTKVVKKTVGANNGYDLLSIKMDISGTFAQIQDFFLKMEQISPFTTVTKMEISGEVGDVAQNTSVQKDSSTADPAAVAQAKEPQFRASVITQTYFYTQQLAVKIDADLPAITAAQQNVLAALASFVPFEVAPQTEVVGGGLEDPFGVKGIISSEKVTDILESGGTITPSLLSSQATQAIPEASPTPAPAANPAETTPATTTP